MKYPRLLSLSAALVSLLAAGAARADYVDFTTATWTSHTGGLTTEVNGVQITVTSTNGAVDTWWGGVHGFGSGYGYGSGQYSDGSYAQDLAISFSSPVDIASANLFDYARYTYTGCYGYSCPGVATNQQVGSYSVDGSATTQVVAGAPSSSNSIAYNYTYNDYYGNPYTFTQTFAGATYFGGDPSNHTFTQNIGQTGSQIVFTANSTYASPPPGYDYTYGQTNFGILGVSFTASNRVPELNASAVTTALALLLGALMLMTERRRRAVGRA